MRNYGKVTVVLDAQAGSCGKGKFIGYLAQSDDYDGAINNFMSNAGHTYVDDDGEKFMTQHLPTSMVNDETILMIGPGAAITPSILFNEILKYHELLGYRNVAIHPRAVVIKPEHCDTEKRVLRSGSTFKGCGAAQADKVMRQAQLFGDWFKNTDWTATPVELGEIHCGTNTSVCNLMSNEQINIILDTINVRDTMLFANNMINAKYDIMVEGSQGCDLDINYGLDYPHTTSRQCHAGQLVADCGISPRLVTDVIMIMRPYPIRISNKTNIGVDISSGDYDGADEITWDIVRERCGAPSDVEFGEMTTVTKKMRRVFEMNWDRLRYVTMLNRPTGIAINFAQYVDWEMSGANLASQITPKMKKFIKEVESVTGVPVVLIGTGARNCDIIDLR